MIGKVREGAGLIGTRAPSLDGVRWSDGKSHPLDEDRGRVVLVRWWTDTCPLCVNSAGAIRSLSRKYGGDLAVRAVYHNKVAGRRILPDRVLDLARVVGMPGTVGHDGDWSALRRWWLDRGGRSFTSVTFVLDRRGLIRLIHTGGEFHDTGQVPTEACVAEPEQCRREYEAIDRAIAVLVAEGG